MKASASWTSSARAPRHRDASATFEQHEGRPAEVLARIGALRDADEIVVGARRLGRLRALVSSVSRALLRSANPPGGGPAPFDRDLLAGPPSLPGARPRTPRA